MNRRQWFGMALCSGLALFVPYRRDLLRVWRWDQDHWHQVRLIQIRRDDYFWLEGRSSVFRATEDARPHPTGVAIVEGDIDLIYGCVHGQDPPNEPVGPPLAFSKVREF